MRNDANAASSLARSARRLSAWVGVLGALLLVGCVNERWEPPLTEYKWHGHDEQKPPSPAGYSSRVSGAKSAPALLSEVKGETLTVWRQYMAEGAVENYRTRAAAELDPKRRDELCAEFLNQAIQEHIEYAPAEKIDYELCQLGMASRASSPPSPPVEISNQVHNKLVENDRWNELNMYYENCGLYKKRSEMLQNIRRVFADSQVSEEAARDRFPLVMMLHYEQIGRSILLKQAYEKLQEGL